MHRARDLYVRNLPVEQDCWWRQGYGRTPRFAKRCRQLTEAHAGSPWLAERTASVRQQAIRDHEHAKWSSTAAGSPCSGRSTSRLPFAAQVCHLLVADPPEADGHLVRDVTEILTSLHVRLHGRGATASTATQGIATITGSAVPWRLLAESDRCPPGGTR